MSTVNTLKTNLKSLAKSEKSEFFPKFFKTGKGEYGEGDKFIGVTVPNCRKIAKQYETINSAELEKLIKSEVHEERLVALIILTEKMRKANETLKQEIMDFYLKNLRFVNNWDLVDISCTKILGKYLQNQKREILYKLANSGNLWEKRISIVTTLAFVKNNDFADSIQISEILLKDSHDLIQKAVGWILREVGKKDEKILENFLIENYQNLSRTTLRYAIERFEEKKRIKFLKGDFTQK